jgi:hypothetical protein
MTKQVDASSIANPSACNAQGMSEACRRRSSPITANQSRLATPNATTIFLSAGLVVAHRRTHPLGQQRGIGFGQPRAAGYGDDRHRRQEHPGRRPMQRARGREQQRAHRGDPDQALQQPFRDHAVRPPQRNVHDRVIFGKLATGYDALMAP